MPRPSLITGFNFSPIEGAVVLNWESDSRSSCAASFAFCFSVYILYYAYESFVFFDAHLHVFFCCIINRTFNQMDIFCCLLVIIFGGREYSLGMQILQLFMNCSQPCGRGLKHGHLSYIMCLRLPLVSYTRSAVACQELWVIVHIFIYRL